MSSSYTDRMENFDVHPFIVCVFNVDKHNIIMIDVPNTHMCITSWAFLSVFEMDFINTRYIKSYMTSRCLDTEICAI